uniref:ATP-binding protein n=1 Tax=Agathobacter sp. TaxID=2021311 RepID=UPI00405788B6
MKRKINIRLIGIALFAILVTLIGVASIYYELFQSQVKNDLHILAEVLVDSDILEQEKEIEFENMEVRITWIDMDGKVLYDNRTDAKNMENHANRPEIMEAMEHGEGESVRNSDTLEMNTYYYALRMQNGSVVRVSRNANSAISIFLTPLPMLLVIVGVVITLCVILADYLTKTLLRPIEALTDSMEHSTEQSQEETVYKELIPFVQTIRSQHENILKAAKMRQDFTANVTHELKTPLTAIAGYAELIENRMADKEQQVKFAGEIRKNSDRLLRLINDIIRLSELDSIGDLEYIGNVDLYALAAECAKNHSVNALRRGISFTLCGSKCIIRGNRDMLCELIDNLCENAIRYNNAGGMVTLVAEMQAGKPHLIVEDNGIGIPKEHQARVFERFYRVDKSRSKATGGTGLGLAIVKHIVAIHEAEIFLESEVGKGTKVTVVF